MTAPRQAPRVGTILVDGEPPALALSADENRRESLVPVVSVVPNSLYARKPEPIKWEERSLPMYARIIDENNPRYHGPLPKPRGLLAVPPEIADKVAREQAAHQPNYSDAYAKLTRDDWTLTYYYEGDTVACRSTPEGVEVLAVGWEEVGRFFEETPPENRQGVMIRDP